MRLPINCDLGEGGTHDERLMPLICYGNIACGGHFGNAASVEKTATLALKHQVRIGAHPSYPDVENFGRKKIDISMEDLKKSLHTQILLVKETAERLGGELHHIKPHGALYNELKHNQEKAELLIDLITKIDDKLILFVPPQSVIQELAKTKLKTLIEGFADRAYNPDFSLVSRQQKGAVLSDKTAVENQVKKMIFEDQIIAINGKILQQKIDTICLHSDTPNAAKILEHLHKKMNT